MRLTRRQLVQGAGVAGLGLLAGCGRWPGQAAPPPKVQRIGFLTGGAPNATSELMSAFRQGLQDLGWLEGRHYTMDVRYADGRADRLPEFATELVASQVDVIATAGTPSTSAARAATSAIPIVQVGGAGDLVALGLIVNFARPEANVTGITEMGPQMAAKQLDLFKQAVPGIARVGILRDSSAGSSVAGPGGQREVAAQALGLALHDLDLAGPGGVEGAFEIATKESVDGVVVVRTSGTLANIGLITERATQHGLPSMYDRPAFVTAGGLMAYGPRFSEIGRRGAYYVDRILKGAKPADLPVEQPMRFDFVINVKTAQALGLTIPHHVLLQATEVIQ
jgi:putative tryptophan/tyrosine transport system substrate-binding protein